MNCAIRQERHESSEDDGQHGNKYEELWNPILLDDDEGYAKSPMFP